jgi:hypothetical protein
MNIAALIKLANRLDAKGLHSLADEVDQLISEAPYSVQQEAVSIEKVIARHKKPIQDLIIVADRLDKKGLTVLADKVDRIIELEALEHQSAVDAILSVYRKKHAVKGNFKGFCKRAVVWEDDSEEKRQEWQQNPDWWKPEIIEEPADKDDLMNNWLIILSDMLEDDPKELRQDLEGIWKSFIQNLQDSINTLRNGDQESKSESQSLEKAMQEFQMAKDEAFSRAYDLIGEFESTRLEREQEGYSGAEDWKGEEEKGELPFVPFWKKKMVFDPKEVDLAPKLDKPEEEYALNIYNIKDKMKEYALNVYPQKVIEMNKDYNFKPIRSWEDALDSDYTLLIAFMEENEKDTSPNVYSEEVINQANLEKDMIPPAKAWDEIVGENPGIEAEIDRRLKELTKNQSTPSVEDLDKMFKFDRLRGFCKRGSIRKAVIRKNNLPEEQRCPFGLSIPGACMNAGVAIHNMIANPEEFKNNRTRYNQEKEGKPCPFAAEIFKQQRGVDCTYGTPSEGQKPLELFHSSPIYPALWTGYNSSSGDASYFQRSDVGFSGQL